METQKSPILQTAIDAEGGVGKLADSLGIAQSAVSNWRARGVPHPWLLLLNLKYGNEIVPHLEQQESAVA